MQVIASFRATVMLLVLLHFAVNAFGQVTTATVHGTVLDQTNAVVPEAQVAFANTLAGVRKTASTNERGEFTITFLPVGEYVVTVERTGFKTYVESGLRLVAGQSANLNFTLDLGSMAETVDVTSARPLVEASSSQHNITINSVMRAELPLSRRDFSGLVNLGAGSVSGDSGTMGNAGGTNFGTKVSFNGLAPSSFKFTVDGTDASGDPYVSSMSTYQAYNIIKGLSLEAIEEVQVAKNIFSAEISGTMSGNVNIISKGGTNEFHGSLFELYQSGGMNANDPFLQRKAPQVFHQFGGSLGGPVVRDKVFFFGVYEGYRQTASQNLTGNVPTESLRTRAVAAVPAYSVFFDMYPLPNQPHDPNGTTGLFIGLGGATARDNHVTARGDWNISERQFLNVRFTRATPYRLNPSVATLNELFWDGYSRYITANHTYAGPAWSFQTRFGRSRVDHVRLHGMYTQQPPIPGIDALGFGQGGEVYDNFGGNWNFEEVIAGVKGRHSLKFGMIGQFRNAALRTEEVPIYTYNTEAALLSNAPDQGRFTLGVGAATTPNNILRDYVGGFIQDDIRVRDSLMINLGVRYDYWTVPREEFDRLFNRDNPFGFGPLRDPRKVLEPDYNNFSPRVGFAWSLDRDRKTVVRGGTGVFVSETALRNSVQGLGADSVESPTRIFYSRAEMLDLGIRYPLQNADVRPLAAGGVTDGMNPNFPNPYAIQWTLSVQRQLTPSLAWEVGYVGNHQVKAAFLRDQNQVDRVTGVRPVPGFLQFRYYDTSGSSHYNGLQTSLKGRFSEHIQFDVNYTYSSSMAYTEGDLTQTNSRPQDNDNLRNERGPTPYDVQHRFVSNFLYELPFGRLGDSGRGQRLLLRGWQVGGIFTGSTGLPLFLTSPSSVPTRPDYLGGPTILSGYRDTLQYLNPAAFAQVPRITASGAAGRVGTLGRGAVRAPGFWNLDLALSKNLNFTERTRLQLRIDMFNALNHVNLINPILNLQSANFGRLSGTRPMRTTQLTARYTF